MLCSTVESRAVAFLLVQIRCILPATVPSDPLLPAPRRLKVARRSNGTARRKMSILDMALPLIQGVAF